LEESPEAYVAKLVEVFREVWRVLRGDGTVFLNLGDSYAGSWGNAGGQNRGNGTQRPITRGSMVKDQAVRNGDFVPPGKYGFSSMGIKPKDLIGIPWRVAFALQADGWYLRSDIIWAKPSPMPESVTDRCTKSHEHIFMLTKSARYFYDAEAVKEPSVSDHKSGNGFKGRQGGSSRVGPLSGGEGTAEQWDGIGGTRNRRDVWIISTKPYRGAHFATFPPEIPEICIKAGTSERGCCPVCGAPWARVVERTPIKRYRPNPLTERDLVKTAGGSQVVPNDVAGCKSETVGFRPSCDCGGGNPVPCTVLDPFAGSGTVGAVAKSLGRDYILIEANPDYIELIEARLAAAERPPATLEDFAP
jgi:DNA modification methylase